MDIVQWCVALSIGKSLFLSKMAPYILEDRVEQEEVWPPEHRRDFLDSVDLLDSRRTKPWLGIGGNSKGAGTVTSAYLAPRAKDTMSSTSSKAHISSSVPKNDTIAFGLELKCLVPLLAQDIPDPEPNYTWAISEDGGKTGIPVKPFIIPREKANNVDEIQKLARQIVAEIISGVPGCKAITTEQLAQSNQKESDFWKTHWIVKKANSAFPTEEQKALQGYTWVPIEISSPTLSSDDENGTYKSVELVMNELNRKSRVRTNYSCDIHVHVGRMDGAPFSLSALKRLGMLLWMAEPILRTIRDPKSPNYENIHTWGAELRIYSRLAKAAQSQGSHATDPTSSSSANQADLLLDELLRLGNAHQLNKSVMNPTDLAALRAIALARDYISLGRLLSGEGRQYRRLGFNFSAFGKEDARAHTNPRTVEFRIMEGTTEVEPVISWLRICKAVTSVAVDKTKASRYTDVMMRMLRDGEEYGLRGRDGEIPNFHNSTGERARQQFKTLMKELGAPESAYETFRTRVYDPPPKLLKRNDEGSEE